MGRRLAPEDFRAYCCAVCHTDGTPITECPHISERLRDRLGIADATPQP
jgi:hypothetical protein